MNRVKLLVATWNVGSATPPADLSGWLGVAATDFDMVVVGAQEVPSQLKQGTERRKELAGERRKAGGTIIKALGKKNSRGGVSSSSEANSGSNTPKLADAEASLLSDGVPADVVRCMLGDMYSSDEEGPNSRTRRSPLGASPGGHSLATKIAQTGNAVGRVIKRDKAWRGDDHYYGGPLTQQKRYSKPNDQLILHGLPDDGSFCTDLVLDRNDENFGKTPSWGARLQRALGAEFVKVQKKAMLGLRLHVFVRRKYENRVNVLASVAEGTGVANVLGNKGAVAIKIALDDTVFTFVVGHLAAHEGVKHLAQRNQDVVEILRNLEPVGNGKSVPSTLRSHHVFWLGDLNYRLDIAGSVPGAETWSTSEKCHFVAQMAEGRKYKYLSALDELRREIDMPDGVFVGYQEGRLRFPPTFKLHRDAPGYCYDSERVPSYCDRVLWHSVTNQRFHVKLDRYAAVPSISTSDHKPVHAAFTVQVPTMPHPIVFETPVVQVALEFKSISVTALWKSGAKKATGHVDHPSAADLTPWNSNGDCTGTGYTFSNGYSGSLEDSTDDVHSESTPSGGRRHPRRAGFVQLMDWSFGEFLADDVDPKLLCAPLFNHIGASGPTFDTRMDSLCSAESSTFGGPIALRPVRNKHELNHKHISLAFSRPVSTTSGKLLPTANFQFSEIVNGPVGSFQKLKSPVFIYGQTHAVAECEVRLIYCDRWPSRQPHR